MGSISSSSSLGCSVDLDVIDRQIFKIFGICVSLDIVDQPQDNSDRFFRPSSQSFAELSSLASSADTSEVGGVRDASFVS